MTDAATSPEAGERTERSADGETGLERRLARDEEAGEGGWPGLRGIARALAGLPAFAKLLVRLLGDGRVSLLDRAIFGFTLVYLFVPLDLVPDWLPVVGGLDDLLLVAFSLDRLLYRTDPDVLLEHWDDDPERLLALRRMLDRTAGALPRWVRGLLRAG